MDGDAPQWVIIKPSGVKAANEPTQVRRDCCRQKRWGIKACTGECALNQFNEALKRIGR